MAEDYGRWLYGDAGDRIPVRTGEEWASGKHRFLCADLLGLSATNFAHRVPGGGVAYVDPPWNSGMARGFRTKARVSSGPVDFPGFLERLVSILDFARPSEIFCEMGHEHHHDLLRILRDRGWTDARTYGITYNGKKPAVIVEAAANRLPPAVPHLEGADDLDTPYIVARHRRPAVMFDPCLGRGLTSSAAQSVGAACYGIELHPRRLACALDALPTPPERVA